MDLITLLWLFPLIFMLHNFEEMIMLKLWWRHTKPETLKSPFVKLAHYPQETVVTMIGFLFVLFSWITVVSILLHQPIYGIGLALAVGLQLVGHLIEFVRFGRYMPGVITAVGTLPYYLWLFYQALLAGYVWSDLLLAMVGMGLIALSVLLLLHKFSGWISHWFTK